MHDVHEGDAGEFRVTAGTRAVLVLSDAVTMRSVSLPVTVGLSRRRSLVLHLEEALDQAAAVIGDRVDLVVRGRPFPTALERFDPPWAAVTQPAGIEVDDQRAMTRVPTPDLPLTICHADGPAAAHVVDLSTRGARLLVERDDRYEVGAEFAVEFAGTDGTAVVRRVVPAASPLLVHLGVEFQHMNAEFLIELIHTVGAAAVPSL